jgi:hypothetical protein
VAGRVTMDVHERPGSVDKAMDRMRLRRAHHGRRAWPWAKRHTSFQFSSSWYGMIMS